MIPEPASFLVAVAKQAHSAAVTLEKPPAFDIESKKITEWNYPHWVAVYGATDVVPPPPLYTYVSKEMSAPHSGDNTVNFNKTDEIAIDVGYEAHGVTIVRTALVWDPAWVIEVNIGGYYFRFEETSGASVAAGLDDEQGTLPVAVNTYHCSQYTVTFSVKLQRTDVAMDKWKMETWAKLSNAAKARQSEYDEKLAQLQLNAGVIIAGK